MTTPTLPDLKRLRENASDLDEVETHNAVVLLIDALEEARAEARQWKLAMVGVVDELEEARAMTIKLDIPDTAEEREASRAIDISPNGLAEIRRNVKPGLRGAFPANAATILALIDALEAARENSRSAYREIKRLQKLLEKPRSPRRGRYLA